MIPIKSFSITKYCEIPNNTQNHIPRKGAAMKFYKFSCLIISLSIFLLSSCASFNNISQKKLKCIKKCSNEHNTVMRIQCLSDAIEQYPTHAYYYFLRGIAYKKILKFTCAINDFSKVIELEPANTKAYYYLATAASLATHKQYALYWLQRSLEAGFEDFQLIETDQGLDNIRTMDEFNNIMKKWHQKPVSLN